VFVVPPRVLGGLDSRVAVILDLLDIPSTLFNELKGFRMPADLKLLHVCQGCRSSLVTSEPANGLE
jgi:hypothetical protein